MTDGEKMVWAATYAREFEQEKHPPQWALSHGVPNRGQWEDNVVLNGIEQAFYAVSALRASQATGRAHWDEEGVLLFLLEMLR